MFSFFFAFYFCVFCRSSYNNNNHLLHREKEEWKYTNKNKNYNNNLVCVHLIGSNNVLFERRCAAGVCVCVCPALWCVLVLATFCSILQRALYCCFVCVCVCLGRLLLLLLLLIILLLWPFIVVFCVDRKSSVCLYAGPEPFLSLYFYLSPLFPLTRTLSLSSRRIWRV